MEPSTFIGYFKNLPDYGHDEIDYFISAICVNSKITVKLYDQMSDFYDAYLGQNYIGVAQFGESSLHGSCMKSEETSRNAADFYCNFAGAKIIIARDAEKNILGRAIVWENVMDENFKDVIVSVLDRIYYSHDFIVKIIRDYAQSIGIRLRKKHNDSKTGNLFVVLRDVPELNISEGLSYDCYTFKIKVPASKWHKQGAPYLDTFSTVCLFEDGHIYLTNGDYNDRDCFATCRISTGYARKHCSVCPSCGLLYAPDEPLCSYCTDKHAIHTVLGKAFLGKAVKYKGKTYPDFLFKRGRPLPNLRRHLQIEKLYNENC